MRIAGWEIRAFGGLAHQIDGLEDARLVCLLGRNESGKSTWVDFVRTALLGFELERAGATPRAPWSGHACEGALDLALDGPASGPTRRARVWRRCAAEAAPTGVWMTERAELELGRDPIPPLAGRDPELMRRLAFTSADELGGWTDREWNALEERFFDGAHVALLHSSRAAERELWRAAETRWRADRRGRPRHRVLEAEREVLRRERRAAVTRAARVRELEELRLELERELELLGAERAAVTAAAAAEGERAAAEAELFELADTIERGRRRWFGDAPLTSVARALARLDPAPLADVLARFTAARELELAQARVAESSRAACAQLAAEVARLPGPEDLRGLLARCRDLERLSDLLSERSARVESRARCAHAARRQRARCGVAWTLAFVLAGAAVLSARSERFDPGLFGAGAALLAALGLVELAGARAALATPKEEHDEVRALAARCLPDLRGEAGVEPSAHEVAAERDAARARWARASSAAERRPELERDWAAAKAQSARAQAALAEAQRARAAWEIERSGWLARLPLRIELRGGLPEGLSDGLSDGRASDLATALDELAARIARASLLRRRLRRLAARSTSPGVPGRAPRGAGAAGLGALGARLDLRQSELLEERGRLAADIARLEGEPGVDAIDGELLALEDELALLRAERDELALCATLIGEASARWRERHQPELFARASRYVELLTGGRWNALCVRETADRQPAHGAGPANAPRLGLQAPAASPARPLEPPLSRGLRQQVHWALHLALFEELEAREADGECLPLVCDDAFVDWDTQRTTHGIALVAAVSRTRQVFVLTADEDLALRLASEAGARVIELGDPAPLKRP